MPTSAVFQSLMTLGGILTFGASAPSTPSHQEPAPASTGTSRTFAVISALPGAIGHDLSEIPASTFAALGNFASLVSTGLSSSATTMIAAAGGTFSAAVAATAAYIKALNNPDKVKAWAIPMPDPLTTFSAWAATDFASRGHTAFAAARRVHETTIVMLNNIADGAEIVHLYSAGLNPAHWEDSIAKISARSKYLRITDSNHHEVLGAFRRSVSDLTPVELKKEMKQTLSLLFLALEHLNHLFHKAVSSVSNPDSDSTFQLIKRGTKIFRAAVNPSNHSPRIRQNKLVIQLALCIILHREFTELQDIYIHHLRSIDELPAAVRVFEAASPSSPDLPPSEPTYFSGAYGGGGSMEQPAAALSSEVL
jgi:hypothetical protein